MSSFFYMFLLIKHSALSLSAYRRILYINLIKQSVMQHTHKSDFDLNKSHISIFFVPCFKILFRSVKCADFEFFFCCVEVVQELY